MRNAIAIATLPLWAVLLATGCKEAAREEHHGEPPHEEEGEAKPAAAVVRIDPEMLRDLRLTTAPAAARAGGEGVAIPGQLGVNEDAYAEVGAPISARVVRIHASPGDAVRAGHPLVELESAELGRARADLLAARARSELAARALERARALAAERISPEREVQEAEVAATAAGAELRSARAALRALGVPEEEPGSGDADARLVLRSPVAGTVLERNAVRGQMADPARPLFRVGDLARLWLTVHASERDAVRVQPGAPARVSFPALPGRTFAGTVALVGRMVDPGSRTVPIRVDVPNGDGVLRPGMSASAWVQLGDAGAGVVAVPVGALQRTREGWCVFVPRGDGAFEVRPVRRGRDLGGEVEVLSGLSAGETVVVEGSFLLKAERDKASGEAGHHEH